MRLHGLLGGGDKYVSVCKAWGKLGGSGGMLSREFIFWTFYYMQFGGIWDFFAQT